jgi:hypothetical protein
MAFSRPIPCDRTYCRSRAHGRHSSLAECFSLDFFGRHSKADRVCCKASEDVKPCLSC